MHGSALVMHCHALNVHCWARCRALVVHAYALVSGGEPNAPFDVDALEHLPIERHAVAHRRQRLIKLTRRPLIVAGHAHDVLLLHNVAVPDDVLHERLVVAPQHETSRVGVEAPRRAKACHLLRLLVSHPCAANIVLPREKVEGKLLVALR
jgi:hypothetical protein